MLQNKAAFGHTCLIILISILFVGCNQGGEIPKIDKNASEILGNSVPINDLSETNSTVQTNTQQSPQEPSKVSVGSSSIQKIQSILARANPNYQGQGKFHEDNGVIVAAELPNCELRDLSPLRGLKLQGLDLSGNPVRELRHLKDMPLRSLFLENTRVENLRDLKSAKLMELRLNNSPIQSLKGLEGQPLENLYAVGTRINEVSPLRSSNLKQLWLSESPVSDVSGLAGLPLVSLTLHRTLVKDLAFVRQLPVLQRLHIGETLVEDLSPLAGVNLSRLVFTPSRIKRGMNVARSLYGLREIGTVFDDGGRDITSPGAFWAKFSP
jgi:internalin A